MTAVVARDPADPPVGAQQRGGAEPFEHLDPLLLDHVGGELAQDPPPGGAAAGMDDAAEPVAALEAERDVAVPVGVEADAERLEVGEPGGRLRRDDLGGGAAYEAAAGRDRVLKVPRGGVVDRERGGQPALGPIGRGLGERSRGHERHAGARTGGGERREEPRGPGADHDEIAREPLH